MIKHAPLLKPLSFWIAFSSHVAAASTRDILRSIFSPCARKYPNVQVSLRVRNLAPGPRDLVLMFTEDAADQRALSLEGVRPGTTGYGAGSGVVIETDDEDDGDARDISPAVCATVLQLRSACQSGRDTLCNIQSICSVVFRHRHCLASLFFS